MKRILLVLITLGIAASTTTMSAMSNSRVRKETLFLTDKMAYELRLNNSQYNDVYEINYDFINTVANIMDEVVYGEDWAVNEYNDALDIRNDDLRWVLNSSQYRRFLNTDYFCYPVYAENDGWGFRIYISYTNPNLFYYNRPYIYNSYFGGHYRGDYEGRSYYRYRYNNLSHYKTPYKINVSNHNYIYINDRNSRKSNYSNRSNNGGDYYYQNNNSNRRYNTNNGRKSNYNSNTNNQSSSSGWRIDNNNNQKTNNNNYNSNRRNDNVNNNSRNSNNYNNNNYNKREPTYNSNQKSNGNENRTTISRSVNNSTPSNNNSSKGKDPGHSRR